MIYWAVEVRRIMVMKKMLVYASVAGLAASLAYWRYKKEKSDNVVSKTIDKNANFKPKSQEEEFSQNTKAEEKIYQTKSEKAQDIYERHLEAASIMKEVYSNIMEDFVEDFSDENENKEVIIDSEFVSVMKEIDSITDELNNL